MGLQGLSHSTVLSSYVMPWLGVSYENNMKTMLIKLIRKYTQSGVADWVLVLLTTEQTQCQYFPWCLHFCLWCWEDEFDFVRHI